MKRRYKEGDWFRVPLGGERDAIGIIARACRSRLFGYFFPVDAARTPTFADLKALRPGDAALCALFGGAGLEQARWNSIATSLPFDRAAWPFPQFRARGAFGRTWSRITYDEDSMSVLARESTDEAGVAALPDARIALPEELEDLLRAHIAADAPSVPLAVCEVRPPVDAGRMQMLHLGGRLQFSDPLTERDLDALAAFLNAYPDVELRVHGMPAFDAQTLLRFERLHSLILDVKRVMNPGALAGLHELNALHIGNVETPVPLGAFSETNALHVLELRGRNADVESIHALKGLQTLTLIATGSPDIRMLQCRSTLRALALAHGAYDVAEIGALPMLERLELRSMRMHRLPDLSRNVHLRFVTLRGIRELRDLTPLAAAPALRELRIEDMPQLEVGDFEPLRACAALRQLAVDVHSKSKSREVYRLVSVGTRRV